MKMIKTEIDIQAPAEKVWDILTDIDHYEDWNPFLFKADGKAIFNENIDVTYERNGREATLHCKVCRKIINRELCWNYSVLMKPFFSGRHTYKIDPVDGKTVHFTQIETIKGLFAPLFLKEDTVIEGFRAMDQALKLRAERHVIE